MKILIVNPGPASDTYFYSIINESNIKGEIINVFSEKHVLDNYLNFSNKAHLYQCILLSDIDKFKIDEISHIINGGDYSYLDYEYILNKFSPHRASILSNIKSNKFLLNDFLYKGGLLSLQQQIVNKKTYKEINSISNSVLKPINGFGGNNVFYINCVDDLKILESFTEDFILQDRAIGEEYSVDFISANGDHQITGVWKYQKPISHHHREEIDLVDPVKNKELISKIYKYMTSIFKSIDHKFGATHSEIIIGTDQINLIEINFRLHGHLPVNAQNSSLGTSQSLSSLLNYDSIDTTNNIETYNYMHPVKKILFNNKVERYIENINWDKIEHLGSILYVYKHNFLLSKICKITTSVQTCLGFVILGNRDIDKFNKDVDHIRQFKDQLCSEKSI